MGSTADDNELPPDAIILDKVSTTNIYGKRPADANELARPYTISGIGNKTISERGTHPHFDDFVYMEGLYTIPLTGISFRVLKLQTPPLEIWFDGSTFCWTAAIVPQEQTSAHKVVGLTTICS